VLGKTGALGVEEGKEVVPELHEIDGCEMNVDGVELFVEFSLELDKVSAAVGEAAL
jgi:hypothetical protein